MVNGKGSGFWLELFSDDFFINLIVNSKLAVSQADSAKNPSRSFWTDGLNREKLIYYDQLTEKHHLHPFKRLSSTCKPCSIKYYDKFHEKKY